MVGYNNIAIEAAQARGIPVCTCPGVNAASVAEGALMMMLMLARRVNEQEVGDPQLHLVLTWPSLTIVLLACYIYAQGAHYHWFIRKLLWFLSNYVL